MKYILDYNKFLIFEKYDYSLITGLNQSDILIVKDDIINNLLPLFLLKEEDIFFSGSSGKLKNLNDISTNVNVIIDKVKFIENNNIEGDISDFFKSQIKRLKYNITPIDNDAFNIDWPFKDKHIDVIIHISDNFEWIKFARYCPDIRDGESKYIGKYREALLSSIVQSINKKIISYNDNKDNVKEYSTLIFDRDYGVFKIHKSFSGSNGTLTKAIEVKNSKKLITSNPDKFVDILFNNIDVDDIMTFENLLDAIKSEHFKFPNKFEQIKSRFYKKLTNLNLKHIDI